MPQNSACMNPLKAGQSLQNRRLIAGTIEALATPKSNRPKASETEFNSTFPSPSQSSSALLVPLHALAKFRCKRPADYDKKLYDLRMALSKQHTSKKRCQRDSWWRSNKTYMMNCLLNSPESLVKTLGRDSKHASSGRQRDSRLHLELCCTKKIQRESKNSPILIPRQFCLSQLSPVPLRGNYRNKPINCAPTTTMKFKDVTKWQGLFR